MARQTLAAFLPRFQLMCAKGKSKFGHLLPQVRWHTLRCLASIVCLLAFNLADIFETLRRLAVRISFRWGALRHPAFLCTW